AEGSAGKAAKGEEWCEGSAGPTGDREVRSARQKGVVHKVVRGDAVVRVAGVSATRSPRRPAWLVGMCGERVGWRRAPRVVQAKGVVKEVLTVARLPNRTMIGAGGYPTGR